MGKLPVDTADTAAVENADSSAADGSADASGDAPGDECTDGGVYDCNLQCWVAEARAFIGDGTCDEGDRGPDFSCEQMDFDEGDCIDGDDDDGSSDSDGGSSDGGSTDGGSSDGGSTDGGSSDGGSSDGGSSDGGSSDGGSTDGGSTDGGSTDGGSSDGGSTDGGSSDGGSSDGGSSDGGSSDGGPAPIAGFSCFLSGPAGSPAPGVYDCALTCVSTIYIAYYTAATPAGVFADGNCDDGGPGEFGDFFCPEFADDGGDCDGSSPDDGWIEVDDDGSTPDDTWTEIDEDGSPDTDGSGSDEIGDSCGSGDVIDCEGFCSPSVYVGDGYCDDGSWGYLDCEYFDYDGGDCGGSGSGSGTGGGTTGGGTGDVDPPADPVIGADCTMDDWSGTAGVYDCDLNCVEETDYYGDSYVGDGSCDSSDSSWYSDFNCVEFDYDGGDCCETTCEGSSCGSYDCEDLSAPAPAIGGSCDGGDGVFDCGLNCVEEIDYWGDSSVGDGTCDSGDSSWDSDFNCAEFDYDGGDCCETTCTGSSCGSYDCEDLSAPAPAIGGSCDGGDGVFDCEVDCTPVSYIGDGYCEDGSTLWGDLFCLELGWDAGDCGEMPL
jgi:hypothetical protein